MKRKVKRIIILVLLLTSIMMSFSSHSVLADNPFIVADQTIGYPGSQVTVTGSGFVPNETGITITFDGNPVATSIIADSAGRWTKTFTVPISNSGAIHHIGGYGSITAALSVRTINFIFLIDAGRPPDVISPINGATTTNLTPTFSWPPVVGVTKYEFRLSTTPTFATMVFTDQPETAGTKITDISLLKFNIQYFWRVKAIEPSPGDWSAIANFLIAAPIQPTMIMVWPHGLPSITTTNSTIFTPMPDPEISPSYVWLYIIAVGLLVYCYLALCLQIIAKKKNTASGWLAWIPIFNIYLMCKIAGKPGWWLVFFFIPVLDLVFTIIVWMDIAKACNKSSWIGVFMIIPGVNVILPGYLALSKL